MIVNVNIGTKLVVSFNTNTGSVATHTAVLVRTDCDTMSITLPEPAPAPIFPEFYGGRKLTEAERVCCEKGDTHSRIVAIKSVRERTGCGLIEAKELVDAQYPRR